jgi:uncharacterized protein
MYRADQGVPENLILAHRWYNLASINAEPDDVLENGQRVATSLRDEAMKMRDEVASKMTSAQIAEAQRQASAWRKSE